MPTVFISSTSEDLKQYREAARVAAQLLGCGVHVMEYFPAQGATQPYPACMGEVDKCDLVVVIVAHRYGWVPPDQPGRKPQRDKSITWLECLHAQKRTKEVLAFLVDDQCAWDSTLRESHRTTQATEAGTWTPELQAEVSRNIAKLREFKTWLNGLGFRRTFHDPGTLKAEVTAGLHDWLKRHDQLHPAGPAATADPTHYLEWLREHTGWIDIRGLQVGSGKAHRFAIDQLYIPLKTAATMDERNPSGITRDRVPLEEALRHRRLVISGDPGAGKTTFLRHIANGLCHPGSNEFPIFLRISDLSEHIDACRQQQERDTPKAQDSPKWLVHYLATRSQDLKWGFDAAFLEQKLSEKSTVLMLDGLDEAPNQEVRESLARLFEQATQAYRNCRFVVTTRPLAYAGKATLDGFQEVSIDDLDPAAIQDFLGHWSACLFPKDPAAAEAHCAELTGALHERPEIRRMARNPVMLTALAVVHWNERRMPEQRAELYESVVVWLAIKTQTPAAGT